MKRLLTVSILASLLVACGDQQDTAYWQDHPEERDGKIVACRNQSGAFNTDKVCIAALMAELPKPVSYWKTNKAERKAKLGECQEYAATLGQSPNCINASDAESASLAKGKAVYIPAN